jgi:hypothetical protein
MTDAICFNCKKPLKAKIEMEKLLDDEFPVFCNMYCANEFPSKIHIDEWNKRFAELREIIKPKDVK